METVPPVLKAGTPKPKPNAQESRLKDAQTRLRRDGNDRDAATDLMDAFLTKK